MKRQPPQKLNIFHKPIKTYALFTTFFAILFIYLIWRKPSTDIKSHKKENVNYMYNDINTYKSEKHTAFEGDRIVHLDLKGAPPKISYYTKLFPLLVELGATGLLLEYEDMFPYSGSYLGNISAHNAYSLTDVKTINRLAKENKLKIIPLVQTFGHMEFILKLPEFKDYREVPGYPQVICPTHENSLNVILDMIEQIIQAHPDSDTIHIGADEVYYLGICNKCTSAMSKYNLTKNLLFLEHVRSVVNMISKKHPYMKILMWDDEFRSINQKELRQIDLGPNLQPVVWKYTKDVYEELGPSLWNIYAQIFPNLWVASAFKGATGSNQFVSDVTHYVQNHRSWLSIIAEHKTRVNFQGIIITGWQRYDHFAILCELLPIGIPSLAMSLRLLLGHNDSPLSPPTHIAKILKCEQPYGLIGSVFGTPKCSYPGGNILESVLHLQQLKQEFEVIQDDSRTRGWLSDYNIAHSFSSPQYVESVTAPLLRIREELCLVDIEVTSALEEIYDRFTVDEWKETHLKPFQKQVERLWNAKEEMLEKETWPRRPLPGGTADEL